MKKLLKEYEVKFIEADVAVDREDYEQLIGNATDFSLLKISHGPSAADLVEVDADLFKALVEENHVTQNFEFNLVGLNKFIKVEGASNLLLSDKGDIDDVSSKEMPVPAVVNPVIKTHSTKG